MSTQTPRELLAAADRERRKAEGAEMARLDYRLSRKPVAHRKTGLIGWLVDRGKEPDEKVFETLPPGLHDALYAALTIVQRDAEKAARDLEARVTAARTARTAPEGGHR